MAEEIFFLKKLMAKYFWAEFVLGLYVHEHKPLCFFTHAVLLLVWILLCHYMGASCRSIKIHSTAGVKHTQSCVHENAIQKQNQQFQIGTVLIIMAPERKLRISE